MYSRELVAKKRNLKRFFCEQVAKKRAKVLLFFELCKFSERKKQNFAN